MENLKGKCVLLCVTGGIVRGKAVRKQIGGLALIMVHHQAQDVHRG